MLKVAFAFFFSTMQDDGSGDSNFEFEIRNLLLSRFLLFLLLLLIIFKSSQSSQDILSIFL